MVKLEKVQRRATRIGNIYNLPYEQRLRRCKSICLESRRRYDLLETFKIMMGITDIDYRTLRVYTMDLAVEDPMDLAVEDPMDLAVEDPMDLVVEDAMDQAVEDPAVEDPMDLAVEDPMDLAVEDTMDQAVEDPMKQYTRLNIRKYFFSQCGIDD